MFVTMLYVEGKADEKLLIPLLSDGVRAITRGGSKHSLPVLVRYDLLYGKGSRYLRDRDFDAEPPAPHERGQPTEDRDGDGTVVGYRSVRHEIENYYLDVRFGEAVAKVNAAEWSQQIELGGTTIRNYQAGRWTMGQIRERLHTGTRLNTRPQALKSEYELPASLAEGDVFSWVRSQTDAFRNDVANTVSAGVVENLFKEYQGKLNAVTSYSDVLLWHSGKDLIAQMKGYLQSKKFNDPDAYMNKVSLWVQQNKKEALSFFPEWQELKNLLNA